MKCVEINKVKVVRQVPLSLSAHRLEILVKEFKIIFWDFDGVIKDSVIVKSKGYEKLFLSFGKEVVERVNQHHEANGGVSRFEKIPLYLSWAGEPANGIAVFIPLFGNNGGLDVKWIEPSNFPKHLLRPLADFDEGRRIIDGGEEYNVSLTPGDILLVDPYLIHATQKPKNSYRLSIDFRFVTSASVESDIMAMGTRENNYIGYEKWLDIGKGRGLVTKNPIVPYEKKIESGETKYAADYDIELFDK
jgi:hypothetical protein